MIRRTLAVASLLLWSVAAQAVLVTKNLEITATDFVVAFGAPLTPAVSPVQISFSVTLDNAIDIGPTTLGLTVNSFNLPFGVEYAYSAAQDVLIVATEAFVNGCSHPVSSFCIVVDQFSSSSLVAFFVAQTLDGDGGWHALTIDTTVIPEPATLLLFGSVLAGLALARTRRQARVMPDEHMPARQTGFRSAPLLRALPVA